MAGIDITVLTHVDEETSPPSLPVLLISVIEDPDNNIGGDQVSLALATYTETNKTMHYDVQHEFAVHRDVLLHALEVGR